MFGRATIRLGIGPHSSYYYFTNETVARVIDLASVIDQSVTYIKSCVITLSRCHGSS